MTSIVVAPLSVVVIGALCASELPSAHAQTRDAAGPVATPEHDKQPYSLGTALTLSLASAGVGYGILAVGSDSDSLLSLGVLGAVIGPSVGHFYTGDLVRAIVPALLRGTGGVMILAAVAMSLSDDPHDRTDIDLLIIGGFVLHIGATLYSIADLPGSVRRANERWQPRIAPTPMVGPDRSMGMGFTVSARF